MLCVNLLPLQGSHNINLRLRAHKSAAAFVTIVNLQSSLEINYMPLKLGARVTSHWGPAAAAPVTVLTASSRQ